jgi:protein O-mannosyl-transferase
MTRSSLRCPQIVGLVKQRKSKFLLVELLLLGFIVGVTVWGYYDILDDFFIMDDFDMIRGHSTFHKFLEHWSVPVGGGMYRPLIDLLFIWDFYWWEWNPLGWHLSNLLFHLVNSLLVYALAKHLTHSVYTGVVAGGLFGLHTCHTEAVTWISARMDVVCTTFFLLSVWLFVHQVPGTPAVKTPKWRSFLSVACFTCALLVKEMAVMLPFVLIAHDVIFSADGKPNARALWKQARVYLPYFGVLALYFTIRLTVLDGIGGHVPDWFGFFILENLVWYFKFLAIPFTEMVFSASLFVNVAGIVVVVAVSLLVSKNSRFLILWVLLTLAPVYMLNIGRGVYIASVGFCILLGMLLTFTVKQAGFFSQTPLFHTGLRLVQVVLIIAVFYHYGIALRVSNAWWSQVAEINEKVPLMAKTMYPTFPKNARICGSLRFCVVNT